MGVIFACAVNVVTSEMTNVAPHVESLRIDGITALRGAFDSAWVDRLRDDMMSAFWTPPATYEQRQLTSLAFNLTGVDVSEDMGPFEVAVGTQYDDGRAWKGEMFPPPELWPRFEERGVRKYPRRGDISARSALTVHRGTAHLSQVPRPVLVLGVDAPGAGHAALHDMMVTRAYYDALPPSLKRHLVCRVVDELVPITQKHDIEGLVLAADDASSESYA